MNEYYCQSDFEKACEHLSNLLKENDNLKKENAELKAKLEKKRTSPKGTVVREIGSSALAYSCGRVDCDGWLKVSRFSDGDDVYEAFEEWEEIEIKVKE